MARTPDLERKPILIAQIIDHLLDRPLSSLSFRTLADGIGVSTYTLVYHFGTRADLMHEIVTSVSERRGIRVPIVDEELDAVGIHIATMRRSWTESLSPRALALQRLEFEAGMLETREISPERLTASLHDHWTSEGSRSLQQIGLDPDDAKTESRLFVDLVYGLQHDVLVTRDANRATAAFEHALARFEARIRELLAN